jgi:hypothetical protein
MSDPRAVAYVNWGRWVVECPYGCGNALTLPPGHPTFFCTDTAGTGGCHRTADIEWPPNADQIMAALAKRPAPKHRNWFPAGHPLAVRAEIPHGQTVHELDEETDRHAADHLQPPEDQQRRELDQLLATYGLRLAPDGESLRRL